METNIDVLKNINLVDKKKSSILTNVANLHETLLDSSSSTDQRVEILANIITDTFIISSKIGIDELELRDKLMQKIKLIIAKTPELKEDLNLLLKIMKN